MARTKRPPQTHPQSIWGPINLRLLLIGLLAVGLGVLGINGWPLLGFALAPAGLWLLTLLGLAWKRPALVLQRSTLWVGVLPLVAGLAGVLSAFREGWGGTLGDLVAEPRLTLGIARIALLLLLTVVIAAPRRSWRAVRTGVIAASLLARTAARYSIRAVAYVGMVSVALVQAGARLARRFIMSLVRSHQRRPWHRAALRLLGASLSAPSNVWGFFRGRRPAPAQPRPALLPPLQELPIDEPWEADPARRQEPLEIGPLEEAEQEEWEAIPVLETKTHSEPLPRALGGWTLPAMEQFQVGEKSWVSQEENREKAQLIEETLADYGIEVTVEEIRPGPVVTQFGLVPGWVRRSREVVKRDTEGQPVKDEQGRTQRVRTEVKTRVKVDAILSREKDLALALAALSIRFEAPVPGESFVGLEVPNARAEIVTLRSVMESDSFRSVQRKGRLPVALGKGSGGEPVVADLTEMPHLLIAGATGSGKSACMNTILCSLLTQFTPLELRMFLVDPKRVELTVYNDLPHLLGPVLVQADEASPALRSLIGEMNARYKRFEAAHVRNIADYNRKVQPPESPLPYMVLVVDELADLMMTSPADVEQGLCRLAQLGRATGIHLVVATQRPSVDVLTGLIKANFPSRISFAVSSQVDSRTILDGAGAEKLLGRGDMLFLPTNYIKPKRLQGAYTSDEEVELLVNHWTGQGGAPLPTISLTESVSAEQEGDELFNQAKELARSHKRVSASLLQRRMGIGYPRASGLLDQLQEMGIVEPGDPGASRAVIGLGM